MGFQDDERWFEQNRAYIAQQYQGQWVIVLDASVRGAYPTKADAFNAAVKQFGPLAGFLIVQSIPSEPIQRMASWPT
jgi:hypothetical protein